jgi:Mg2+ and Co2+ transporter CorA
VKVKARLFDADRSDKEVELSPDVLKQVGDRQLLWIDASGGTDLADRDELLAMLPFDREAIKRAWAARPRPDLIIHGDYVLVRVVVLRRGEELDEPILLDLVTTRNIVLTAHRRDVPFLAELDDRIRGDTSLGQMDSTEFASVLMEGLVTSYMELTDEILAAVDTLDGQALKATRKQDLLSELVALRHRIATVRRALAAHRRVVNGLAGADFEVIAGKESTPHFGDLVERFDGAIEGIDTAREALIGTFDVHMSRTAQRTSDVMRVLTIVSVLLLPTGVIAGFLGMNIKTPYAIDDPRIFWIVLVVVIAIAAFTLLVLRARRWL